MTDAGDYNKPLKLVESPPGWLVRASKKMFDILKKKETEK